MTIGFDGSRAFVNRRSGTENYSYQLLLHLSKIDHKNNYIVYLRPGISKGSVFDAPSNFTFKVLNFPRLWTQAGLAIQTFKDPLDALFIPAHTLPLIRKGGLKTVVTVHDLGSEYLPQTHQIKQRLYLSLMQKYQLRGASRIVAVSKATKEDLMERVGIEQDKITVIYEGFDQKLFKRVKNDVLMNSLKQYGLEAGKYFLFVGTVQPRKNLTRVIRSVKGSQVKLVIAGSKGWLADEIYKLPGKLGIDNQVKFLGYVPDKGLPILYSGAIALVFPSLFEGFGLPIIEAQACGCPVLTSNVSSMPEIAGKGAILVDPYRIDDIVKGMGRIQKPNVRQQLIKDGFENIKRFSWEKAALETLKVLEEVGSQKT